MTIQQTKESAIDQLKNISMVEGIYPESAKIHSNHRDFLNSVIEMCDLVERLTAPVSSPRDITND